MPIYEFYCSECHTIYNFFSRSVNTKKTPSCPQCRKDSLTRKISLFSAVTGKGEKNSEADDFPIDESKMERAMNALASDAEHMNEDDPRQAADLMRKLSDMTGLQYQEPIENAISRLEAGEDPESIEAGLGDALGGDDNPFIIPGKKGGGSQKLPPRKDDTLYEM